MQWLAAISVKRPVFASVLILSLTVIGVFSFTRLGVDRFPKIDFPTITVTTLQPGAAPEQIETEITDKMDPDAAPVLSLALTAKQPVRDITEYADKVLRRQIESVNGVGQVIVLGGRKRQINIWLDADRLRSYNLTVTDVSRALQSQNIEIPGGRVDQGPQSVTLRTRGRIQSVAEFAEIVIRQKDGHPVRIGDVARVEDGEAEPETLANVNGTGTVLLQVRRQSGTNTVEVVRAVKERLVGLK